MPQSPVENDDGDFTATAADVRAVFGSIDDDRIASILELRPTLAELEEASLWLSGDADVFGPGRPLKERPGRIVALLTADEEDDSARRG